VSVYVQEVISPNQVEMLANEACRHALAHRGVATVVLPIDYQTTVPDHKYSEHKAGEYTTSTYTKSIVIPHEDQLKRAAEVLNSAKKPAMLVGAGALDAGDEVIAISEKLNAPIVKSLLGKAVVGDDHPNTTCGLGLLGTTPSEDVMAECDVLLMVGTSYPYQEFLPKPSHCRGVQIDDKSDRIGLRFPVDVGLVGNAKETLAALLPYVHQNADDSLLQKARSGMKKWWELMKERSEKDDVPIKPERAAWELNGFLQPNAIISGDSGTNTTWIAQQYKLLRGQKFSCSGTLATMAPGLPYSIAAKVAFPDRQSVAFVGDGGFTMLMGEFATAVKYDLDIKVIIVHNNVLGQIKWEQVVFLGNPEYVCELQNIDFAKFAEACGGVGIAVRHPDEIKSAYETAFANGRPTVVDIYVDANEPPMPGKITVKQAVHFAEALAKGTPNRGQIALTIFRDKVAELV
jgi:pyruvate dehydrogenase (quinone)/pyruvate oxidase